MVTTTPYVLCIHVYLYVYQIGTTNIYVTLCARVWPQLHPVQVCKYASVYDFESTDLQLGSPEIIGV